MRIYPREDGRYDAYNVEPQILTQEEVDKIYYENNLIKRKEELEKELAAINDHLALASHDEPTGHKGPQGDPGPAGPAEVEEQGIAEAKDPEPQPEPTPDRGFRKKW